MLSGWLNISLRGGALSNKQKIEDFLRYIGDPGFLLGVGKDIGNYFPVGNTPPKDLTVGCLVPDDVSILLLGCGDIRNILYTIHILYTNEISPKEPIKFHLNDHHPGILSRAVLLLYIVDNIDPNNEDDMKFLWAVWYDCYLTKEHSRRLKELLLVLLDKNFTDLDVFCTNEMTVTEIKSVFNMWVNENLSVANLMKNREEFLYESYCHRHDGRFPELPTRLLLSRICEQHPKFADDKTYVDLCSLEVKDFVELGITNINLQGKTKENLTTSTVVNPTFLLPGGVWRVEDNSSAFYAFEFNLSRYIAVVVDDRPNFIRHGIETHN